MLKHAKLDGEIDVYLKVNSGMNRLGFSVESLRPAYNALRMHPQVKSLTLMTHFADADGAGGIKAQLDWFNELTKPFEAQAALARQLRRAAALSGGARRLGAPGHHALRLLAVRRPAAPSSSA